MLNTVSNFLGLWFLDLGTSGGGLVGLCLINGLLEGADVVVVVVAKVVTGRGEGINWVVVVTFSVVVVASVVVIIMVSVVLVELCAFVCCLVGIKGLCVGTKLGDWSCVGTVGWNSLVSSSLSPSL